MRILGIFSTILILFLTAGEPAEARRLAGSRSLNDTDWGYLIVSQPTRAGNRAQRFEVRPGDCGESRGGWSDCDNDRERSEISLKKRWRYGKNQWIAFSIYLPGDFRTSSRVNTTAGQIHQDGGPSGTAGGLPSYPPLMQLQLKGNRYEMCLHILSGPAENVRDDCKMFQLSTVSAMRGRWTDVMVHLDTSEGNQLIEVFINGTLKASQRDWIRFRPREYYFKYGIYRSFVSRHSGPMPTQVILYDEVRMGRNREKVEIGQQRPVD